MLDTIATLIPCLQLVYFANYQYPITEVVSVALLQTNPEEAKEYFEVANKFKAYHDENFVCLVVTPYKHAFSKPFTIIMVICESAFEYYMSVYGI